MNALITQKFQQMPLRFKRLFMAASALIIFVFTSFPGTSFAQQPAPLVVAQATTAQPGTPARPSLVQAAGQGDLKSPQSIVVPGVKVEFEGSQPGEGNLVPALRLALMLMALTLLPALVLSMTSFTRIVIVMGFVRQAIGAQSLPPSQVLIGLSLFLCMFTMAPVMQEVNEQAVQPYMAGQMSDMEAFDAGMKPMRHFMARHTRPQELELFVGMTQNDRPQNFDEVSTVVLMPAFMLSELRTAFIMGALIYIPFIVIDLVVASVLMAMGMVMVPPAMISLPVKLLLFVMVDGWALIVGSLARSIMIGGA